MTAAPSAADRLAEALAGTSVRLDFAGLLTRNEARRLGEVLAPVVDAIAAERAAEELEAAARTEERRGYIHVADHLRDRAAALRAAAPTTDTEGCPDAPHHGVDCPGDACRYAATPTNEGTDR